MIRKLAVVCIGTVSDMEIEFAETQRCKERPYACACNTGHIHTKKWKNYVIKTIGLLVVSR